MTTPPRPPDTENNPYWRIRTCPYCGDEWWEHDHSVAETMRHLHEKHPEELK